MYLKGEFDTQLHELLRILPWADINRNCNILLSLGCSLIFKVFPWAVFLKHIPVAKTLGLPKKDFHAWQDIMHMVTRVGPLSSLAFTKQLTSLYTAGSARTPKTK